MTPQVPSPTRIPSGIESKIAAAGGDADRILLTLDTELALRRAGRKFNDNNRKVLRMLSILMLCGLLLAALGAMYYLQTQYVGHGSGRRAGPATASPARDP